MNVSRIRILLAATCIFSSTAAMAQYKGPRDYFPKTYPAPPARGSQPATPNAPEKQPPAAKAQQPKFKDLAVNTQFYFISDTNRVYSWTKTSATAAKNSKTGATQTISGEALVQK